MNAQQSAVALPAELAIVIAALPVLTFEAAIVAINSSLRAQFMSRLSACAIAGNLSDQLVGDIGAAIALQCDRVIALRAPIQDRSHVGGPWTSIPINCLTEAERNAL